MVDFKKLSRQMREARERGETQPIAKQGDCQFLPTCAPLPRAHFDGPVLETALHREMRDPDYLRSLDQYVDER